MPKNLTLVVTTPKGLGTLPVVIIINHLALNGLISVLDQVIKNLECWEDEAHLIGVPLTRKQRVVRRCTNTHTMFLCF